MPCTYTGTIEGDQALIAESKNKELTREIIHLTQMLCCVCEEAENRMELPEDVEEWWAKHKAQDLRAQALAKLTPDERRVLGLTE